MLYTNTLQEIIIWFPASKKSSLPTFFHSIDLKLLFLILCPNVLKKVYKGFPIFWWCKFKSYSE